MQNFSAIYLAVRRLFQKSSWGVHQPPARERVKICFIYCRCESANIEGNRSRRSGGIVHRHSMFASDSAMQRPYVEHWQNNTLVGGKF